MKPDKGPDIGKLSSHTDSLCAHCIVHCAIDRTSIDLEKLEKGQEGLTRSVCSVGALDDAGNGRFFCVDLALFLFLFLRAVGEYAGPAASAAAADAAPWGKATYETKHR